MQDSAAAIVRPCSPREVEHELLDRPVVLREHRRTERLLQRRRELLRRAEELGPDLASVRANRRLDALGLPSQLGERLCDCGLAYAVSTQDMPLRSLGAPEHPPHRLVLERRLPEPPQLRRRAG